MTPRVRINIVRIDGRLLETAVIEPDPEWGDNPATAVELARNILDRIEQGFKLVKEEGAEK